MKCRDLIDLNDLSSEDWESIISLAQKIRRAPSEYARAAQGQIIATLFFEPSTRTQLSFQTAMLRLGGQVIGFGDPQTSSIAKGETLKDTVKMISGYADLVVIRHPLEGAAKAASLYSSCPVINAGDGGHNHPTQTLTDLLTISEEKKLDGLTVGFCGDLKNGRTVHSLVKALARFPANRLVFISTPGLALPEYLRQHLTMKGVPYVQSDSLEEQIGSLDVLYMTRIQKERFPSEEAYRKEAGVYILDEAKMKKARADLLVMHPLPKVDEITDAVDADPRCVYFQQAEYGMYIRMALLNRQLTLPSQVPPVYSSNVEEISCKNPRCICNHERYLPPRFFRPENDPASLVCEYCDTPARL